MKKKILTLFGVILFIVFLYQIKLDKLLDIINFKNLILFVFSICFVVLSNVVLYFRFKSLVNILFKRNFFKEFIYYKFLSILSFKDIGDIISKFYIINKQTNIKKSKNIVFVSYEKIFDALITLIILFFALLLEVSDIKIKFILFILLILVLNSKTIKYLINLINKLIKNKFKEKRYNISFQIILIFVFLHF